MGIADYFSDMISSLGFPEAQAEAPAENVEQTSSEEAESEEKPAATEEKSEEPAEEESSEEPEQEEEQAEEEGEEEEEEEEEEEAEDIKPKLEEGKSLRLVERFIFLILLASIGGMESVLASLASKRHRSSASGSYYTTTTNPLTAAISRTVLLQLRIGQWLTGVV